jgi:hypothetical protein
MCGPRPVTDRSPVSRFSNSTSSSIAPQCPPSPPSVSTSISLSVAPADGSGDYATVKQQMFEDKPVSEQILRGS